MNKTTTKENLLQEHDEITFYNEGLKTDMPTEIFMIKVKDRTLLSELDIEILLNAKDCQAGDDDTSIPYVKPGRGWWMQSSWNSKRFLTKKSAENWLAKELGGKYKEELMKNLVIVKTKCNWEEA